MYGHYEQSAPCLHGASGDMDGKGCHIGGSLRARHYVVWHIPGEFYFGGAVWYDWEIACLGLYHAAPTGRDWRRQLSRCQDRRRPGRVVGHDGGPFGRSSTTLSGDGMRRRGEMATSVSSTRACRDLVSNPGAKRLDRGDRGHQAGDDADVGALAARPLSPRPGACRRLVRRSDRRARPPLDVPTGSMLLCR